MGSKVAESKYRPEYAERAAEMCRNGAVPRELAHAFDVSDRTIQSWRMIHTEFRDAVRQGNDVADDRVEMSLYHRAIGYAHEDIDIKVVDGEIVITELTKHYAPDVEAAKFWLTNRRPEKWRNKTDVQHSGWVASLSEAELDAKIAKAREELEAQSGPLILHAPQSESPSNGD